MLVVNLRQQLGAETTQQCRMLTRLDCGAVLLESGVGAVPLKTKGAHSLQPSIFSVRTSPQTHAPRLPHANVEPSRSCFWSAWLPQTLVFDGSVLAGFRIPKQPDVKHH